MEVHRRQLWGPFTIHPKQPVSSRFSLDLPWEAPLTVVAGHHLHGMSMGISTDVEIASAVDRGDLDAITIHPLPAQERILAARSTLGFQFGRADLERGRIREAEQTLPFYQEIEFHPAPQYASGIRQLELTFVTNPHRTDVVLEFDRRGGLLSEGRDVSNHFSVDHHTFQQIDWGHRLHELIASIVQRRGIFF